MKFREKIERAIKLKEKGDFEEALSILLDLEGNIKFYKNLGMVSDEDIIYLYGNIGLIYEKIGDIDKAIEYYQKVIKLDNKNNLWWVYLNLSKCLRKKGRLKEALRFLFKASIITPKEEMYLIYWNLGEIYKELGRINKAIQYLSKTLDKVEDNDKWHVYNDIYEILKNSIEKFPNELKERYNPLESISCGANYITYKVLNRNLNQVSNLKIFTKSDKNGEIKYKNEVSALLTLKHNNIIKMYNFGLYPTPYIELESNDTNLGDYIIEKIKTNNFSDISKDINIVINVLEGIRYAHSQGRLHLNIKPQSILISNNNIKVSDWSLSANINNLNEYIYEYDPYYAAPEQIKKEDVWYYTDIWQIGVLMYELFTGSLPYNGSKEEVLEKILNEDPIPPININKNLGEDLNKIILKCLNKNPNKRYQNILELLNDIKDIQIFAINK
ncbi:protein kinase domain-containing protein [Methanocaldococcus sp.]